MKWLNDIPSWWVECVLGYLALAVVNARWFSDNPAFTGTEPHPYLILILFIAVRYGLAAGVVSALIGIAILAVWAPSMYAPVWSPMNVASRHGLSFLLLGAVIGHLRGTAIRREEALEDELTGCRATIGQLQKKTELLQDLTHKLEGRILNEVHSFAKLYDISQNLSRLDRDEICRNVPEVIADHLHAEQCSIYLYEDGALRLKNAFGWDDNRHYRKTIPLDRSIVGIACTSGKPVSIREFLETPSAVDSLGESVMAAPLFDQTKQLIGAINIESIPFLEVNQSSLTIFSILARWISHALGNAIYFEKVRAHTVEDQLLEIYNRRYLDRRLAEEFARSKIYYLPVSLALIKLAPLPDQSQRSRLEEIKVMIALLMEMRRDIDTITVFSEDIPLAILMTTSGEEEASEFVEQARAGLMPLLPQVNGKPRLQTGIASFKVEMNFWEELVHEAVNDLR